MAHDLPARRPHGAHKVYLVRINRFESAQKPHRDGKECGHHNEHHLGQHAVAKPQHQQRSDGDRRDGLRKHHQGVERTVEHLEAVHGDRRRGAQRNTRSKTDTRLRQRGHGMARQ